MIIFYLSSVIVVVMFSTVTYGIEYVDVFFMVHYVCQFIFHVLNVEVTIMVAYGLYGLLTLFYLFRFFDFQNFLDFFFIIFFSLLFLFLWLAILQTILTFHLLLKFGSHILLCEEEITSK